MGGVRKGQGCIPGLVHLHGRGSCTPPRVPGMNELMWEHLHFLANMLLRLPLLPTPTYIGAHLSRKLIAMRTCHQTAPARGARENDRIRAARRGAGYRAPPNLGCWETVHTRGWGVRSNGRTLRLDIGVMLHPDDQREEEGDVDPSAVRRLARARQRGPRGHGPSSGPAGAAAHARQSI